MSPDSLVLFQRPTSHYLCASGDEYPPDPSWRRSSGRPRNHLAWSHLFPH